MRFSNLRITNVTCFGAYSGSTPYYNTTPTKNAGGESKPSKNQCRAGFRCFSSMFVRTVPHFLNL